MKDPLLADFQSAAIFQIALQTIIRARSQIFTPNSAETTPSESNILSYIRNIMKFKKLMKKARRKNKLLARYHISFAYELNSPTNQKVFLK
jgi:hypothetical protein